ncbi:short chain dehydrogenase [Actinomadura xylanilytica]|uniref:short chain dehydrogenase n=1 Tax=Actinomadura xylanilytica TaxID=887459 RepID=UPI00255ABCF6|nr:short chain dehydrogenase [Actinomadura xylanilytica]MDL4773491.1 short chain dehydrogenase [Actinomadura xylanilytica]
MKIIVIGATGTIGSAVAAALEPAHEVVRASRRGPVRVDMHDLASIDALFETVPDADAVVCCAASGVLSPLDSDDDAVLPGVEGKLYGQVHLVRTALRHLPDGGSVTLTSGVIPLSLKGASFGALANAGLDAFVRFAATELPRGLRVNAVSPGWVAETLESMGLDAAEGTPAKEVADAFVQAAEGTASGHTFTFGG